LTALPRHRNRAVNVFSHPLEIWSEPSFEIGVQGRIDAVSQSCELLQHVIPSDSVVWPPCRPGVTRARRSQSFEPERIEHPGAADIPGARQDEAPALMQFAEPRPLLLTVLDIVFLHSVSLRKGSSLAYKITQISLVHRLVCSWHMAAGQLAVF
jgi:hypothetical protein